MVNADFSKEIAKDVSAYFGTEARSEKYALIAGEEAFEAIQIDFVFFNTIAFGFTIAAWSQRLEKWSEVVHRLCKVIYTGQSAIIKWVF